MRDLKFALELADIADARSLPRFMAADLAVSTKPDTTFVTDADTAVEAAIRDHIEQNLPDDGFFGEESGTVNQGSRQWIIDPIDGTSNFLRGVPNWATLIALAIDGKPVVGVVSAPAFGKRWWGATGLGAWMSIHGETPAPLQVSQVAELKDASLSFQSIRQWDDAGYLNSLVELTRTIWRDRAYGDMWSYMLLAEGQVDIVAEFDVKPYDLAALVPIVTEAGGRFSDIEGNDSAWNGSALATNGVLHDSVVDFISRHNNA
jgi:histidinol-phosphatase